LTYSKVEESFGQKVLFELKKNSSLVRARKVRKYLTNLFFKTLGDYDLIHFSLCKGTLSLVGGLALILSTT